MARIYLATFGSFGDVYPFIALSRALKEAGAEPIAFVNPAELERFATAGIEALPAGDRIDIDKLLAENPKYFHPRNGTRHAIEDLFGPFSGQVFRAASMLAAERPPDLCISHHMAIGPAWLARERGVPSLVVHLAPASLLSIAAPPAIGPSKMKPWARRLALRMALPLFRRMATKLYLPHAVAAGVDASAVDVTDTTRNPDRILGMWSKSFRGPASDDPDVTRITGFPTAPVGAGISEELDRFLKAGDAPIGFGLGSSAVNVPGGFFDYAVRVCSKLGRRGLLFMGDRPPPDGTGDNVIAVGFEPFDAVLPRCAAFVHHASIGSTAAGLRAGIPMVAIPHAHDQFDNADRIETLGAGQSLARKGLNAAVLTRAVRAVLEGEAPRHAARVGSEIAREGDGAKNAAKEALELL